MFRSRSYYSARAPAHKNTQERERERERESPTSDPETFDVVNILIDSTAIETNELDLPCLLVSTYFKHATAHQQQRKDRIKKERRKENTESDTAPIN